MRQNSTNLNANSGANNAGARNANAKNTGAPISYKNFILLGFVLSALYALCFFVMRVVLAFDTFDEWQNDFVKMFVMGFRLDMRAVCVVFAVILLLGYATSTLNTFFHALNAKNVGVKTNSPNSNNALGGGALTYKLASFCTKFTLFFATFSSFLIIISALINFYYFATYHTKIDIFIFGLKDDDTEAILRIIWADYPALTILLASGLFAFLCFKLSRKILNLTLPNLAQIQGKFAFLLAFVLNLSLVALVFIGIRGSVGTFPLREDEHHISANPLINHISTNPIIAFAWAYQHYKEQESFAPIDETHLKALQDELFPIFRANSSKQNLKQPNVIVVLMESFGSNLLLLDDEKDFDLLMSFRKDFEAGKTKRKGQSDFTFVNFLSGQNGTAGSFASLFFLSPSANISLSSVKNKALPLTPFAVYQKAGYEVVYITSGNRSWQNFGDYISALGANAVYDSNFLAQHYPQSKEFQNVYGVGDEFAYKFALELLQNATKPLFVVILTTSNHPPYSLPLNFATPKYDIEGKKAFFRQDSVEKIRTSVSAFSYASNAFGEFITRVKASSFKDNTIVAMSGDHIYRDLKAYDNAVLNHAVPFYLYVPNAYTKDFAARKFDFAPDKLGSHKDIFPTLYALSLNECEFLSLGGRNLFDTKADARYNFAYNGAVWIDESGVYARGAKTGFFYKDTAGKKAFFVNSKDKESFEIPQNKAEFFDKYNQLDWLQLNFRLFQFERLP